MNGQACPGEMKYKVTNMLPIDLPEVMGLERESFSSPWTEEFFLDELTLDYSHIFLARDESGSLVGFICFWVIFGEVHILNIAVRKSLRRQGVGRFLAVEALRYAREKGAGTATLEVRERNSAAIGLYESLGFVRAGLRKGYYGSPPDNAVIMWLYDIDATLEKSP